VIFLVITDVLIFTVEAHHGRPAAHIVPLATCDK
jgi:hypothetical protein